MPQVFIPPGQIHEDKFTVLGSEAHHLLRVLRKKEGDRINCFDGSGHQFEGVITRVELNPMKVMGRVGDVYSDSGKPVHIHLWQGLCRPAKFDYVLEKATELGVDAITPFLSQKSPVKLTEDQIPSKIKRWTNLVIAASKQSNRSHFPEIHAPRPITDLSGLITQSNTFVLWEKEKKNQLKMLLKQHNPENRWVNIVVGPEAGFHENEIDVLKKQGAITVGMGDRPLRTETAGLTLLSILNYEWELF